MSQNPSPQQILQLLNNPAAFKAAWQQFKNTPACQSLHLAPNVIAAADSIAPGKDNTQAISTIKGALGNNGRVNMSAPSDMQRGAGHSAIASNPNSGHNRNDKSNCDSKNSSCDKNKSCDKNSCNKGSCGKGSCDKSSCDKGSCDKGSCDKNNCGKDGKKKKAA